MKKLLITSLLGLASCASIVQGSTNRIDISTNNLQRASCNLTNGRGSWQVEAPGSTLVKRSKTDLKVDCANAQGTAGEKIVESDLEPWVIGDIPLFFIISAPIDFITGSAWKYDKDVTVNFIDAPRPVVTAPPIQPPLAVPEYPTGR